MTKSGNRDNKDNFLTTCFWPKKLSLLSLLSLNHSVLKPSVFKPFVFKLCCLLKLDKS